ncbi:hypothetical protein CTI14_60760, partial [Methylobacterium radiotolerans]
MKHLLVSLERLHDFDEIIDVRTPLEYADDHIPGACNAPVLNNEERALIGTMYKQVSPFEASREAVFVKHLLVSLERLHDFDEIIDVRTPLEYAD